MNETEQKPQEEFFILDYNFVRFAEKMDEHDGEYVTIYSAKNGFLRERKRLYNEGYEL